MCFLNCHGVISCNVRRGKSRHDKAGQALLPAGKPGADGASLSIYVTAHTWRLVQASLEVKVGKAAMEGA